MPIAWTPKLAVGVPVIDEQHRELFRRIAALLAAMSAGRGRAHLVDTLEFLDAYVLEHFSAETALMRESGYPLLQWHLGAHAHFVAELRKLWLEVDRDELAARTVVRAGGLLCDWLREHIATADRDFGKYLTEQGHPHAAPRVAGGEAANVPALPDDRKPASPAPGEG
jgi:hemerythrin